MTLIPWPIDPDAITFSPRYVHPGFREAIAKLVEHLCSNQHAEALSDKEITWSKSLPPSKPNLENSNSNQTAEATKMTSASKSNSYSQGSKTYSNSHNLRLNLHRRTFPFWTLERLAQLLKHHHSIRHTLIQTLCRPTAADFRSGPHQLRLLHRYLCHLLHLLSHARVVRRHARDSSTSVSPEVQT